MSLPQSRVPAGVRTGGQFAAVRHGVQEDLVAPALSGEQRREGWVVREVTPGGSVVYLDENGDANRIGHPAIEEPDGFRAWMRRGKLHRLEGPATVPVDGSEPTYAVNGVPCSALAHAEAAETYWNETCEEIAGRRVNDEPHPTGGYTTVDDYGPRPRYFDADGQLHREDGPAEGRDWYIHGKKVDVDGMDNLEIRNAHKAAGAAARTERTGMWTFNGNRKDLGQVQQFAAAYEARRKHLMQTKPSIVGYDDSYRGLSPELAGRDQESAIYLLQGLRRRNEYEAGVQNLRDRGFADPGALPSGHYKFGEIAVIGSKSTDEADAYQDGIHIYDDARLVVESGKIVGLLPKGKRVYGITAEGTRQFLVRSAR